MIGKRSSRSTRGFSPSFNRQQATGSEEGGGRIAGSRAVVGTQRSAMVFNAFYQAAMSVSRSCDGSR